MSALSIQVPFPVFQDRDGQPLDNGYVWLGTSSLNPQTNPVVAYYDSALTIVATQPLRTLNGFISRAGSPAQVYVDAVNFSILVQDRQGTTVFSVPEGTGISPNASGVVYDPAGTGAVATTVQAKLRESVSVLDFGASSSASSTENLAAFKSAVAATATGGKLVVPVQSSFYSILTSGGLSTAIEINKRMEIVFEGDVKATFGTMQANPPYIFKVTADGVTFSGNGKIIGNGTIDDTNAGDETTFPGLIYVTGDNFTMNGLTIDTPPKLGVLLYSSLNAKITNCIFTGGVVTYSSGATAYFAIRSTGGGGHIIKGNQFIPDASGGTTINAIFFGGLAGNSNGCIISNNVAKAPHEKITYLYGDYNKVIGNYVDSAINTDSYRHHGSYNTLENNISKDCKGGCQVFDGVGNSITGNSFIGCLQAGIIVAKLSAGYAGGFNNTKVIGNTVTGDGAAAKTDGIRVSTDSVDCSGIVVSDNIVSNMTALTSEGLIRLISAAPYAITDALISNNRLVNGTNGVYLSRVINSIVSGNLISGCTNYPIVESGGAYSNYYNNKGRVNTNIGINGLSSASFCTGNQWTNASLSGSTTLSAAVTNTITHGGVAANAIIFLQAKNTAAGVTVAVKGYPVTGISGADFVITMANGTAAVGTEQFYYQISQ